MDVLNWMSEHWLLTIVLTWIVLGPRTTVARRLINWIVEK